MATVTSLEHRRTRRAVLSILGCERPMTLGEIAHAADQHFALDLDRIAIKAAIADLQERGHPIQRHQDAVGDEYQLVPGWGGGSAA